MFQRPLRLLAAFIALALPLLVGACSKSDTSMQSQNDQAVKEIQVTSVDLGKSVGADNRIVDKSDTFAPTDIVYAAVLTDGAAPNAILKTTWMFQDGQVVSQSERAIAPSGAAATEFHIEKADGLPAGKYKVVISLNGNPVQTKEFEVKAT